MTKKYLLMCALFFKDYSLYYYGRVWSCLTKYHCFWKVEEEPEEPEETAEEVEQEEEEEVEADDGEDSEAEKKVISVFNIGYRCI